MRAVLAAVLALAACGGGGSVDEQPTREQRQETPVWSAPTQ